MIRTNLMNPSTFSEEYTSLLPPYHLEAVHLLRYWGGTYRCFLRACFQTGPKFSPNDESWVLDPFGLSPALDLEIAQNGNKVFVCVNNPITRILLETVYPTTD